MTEFYAGIQDSWKFEPKADEVKIASWIRRHGKPERERIMVDAAGEGKGWLVEYLLVSAAKENVHPVNINAWNDREMTALMAASSKGHAKVVELLVSHAASVNKVNDYAETAALLAAEGGHVDVLKVLDKAGADLSVRFRRTGETLAERAKGFGHKAVEDYLAGKNGTNSPVKNTPTPPRMGDRLRVSMG